MTRRFFVMLGVSVVVIAAALYLTVSENRKGLLSLTGAIQNVRVRPLGAEASLAIIDFKGTNLGDIPFEMTQIEVEALANGETLKSGLLTKSEVGRYLEFEKLETANAPLGLGDVIKAGQTDGRMVAARFEVPSEKLDGAEFVLRFVNPNRVTSEIKGRKP